MAGSKLEAMAIYPVKQACGNDKRACVDSIKFAHFNVTLSPTMGTTEVAMDQISFC